MNEFWYFIFIFVALNIFQARIVVSCLCPLLKDKLTVPSCNRYSINVEFLGGLFTCIIAVCLYVNHPLLCKFSPISLILIISSSCYGTYHTFLLIKAFDRVWASLPEVVSDCPFDSFIMLSPYGCAVDTYWFKLMLGLFFLWKLFKISFS